MPNAEWKMAVEDYDYKTRNVLTVPFHGYE
jgi:hypothetical protein